MLELSGIKIEQLVKPVGITSPFRVSWVLESDERDVKQNSYQIRVRRKGAENWSYDSGIVESSSSVYNKVEMTLESLVCYEVHVRAMAKDMETPWYYTEFTSGLQDIREWKGDFITAEPENSARDAEKSYGTLVRRDFCVDGEVKEAYLISTALGLYHIWINGQLASPDEMAPGWTSYHKRLQYQTYEVTDLLEEGQNAIGVMLGAGWYKGMMGYKHCRNLYGDRTAFAGQLLIRYQDGREEVIMTNENWMGSRSAVLFSEIYDGESYDARLEQAGWNCVGFPMRMSSVHSVDTDSAFSGNVVDNPWISGDATEVPAEFRLWKPVEVIEGPIAALVPQRGVSVRQQERLQPKRIFRTPEGDLIIDFGQNMTGWCEFTVRGAKAGDVCELQFFEILDASGNMYTENLRGAMETLRYTCRGSVEETYRPWFSFQGFQYARVNSWAGMNAEEVLREKEAYANKSGSADRLFSLVSASELTGVVVHSDMPVTGAFACSNPLLNQLWHNILWGLKGNSLDIPTDCPQRDERIGWTGDIVAFGRTASYLMDTQEFYGKWLADVAADQNEDGSVPHVVPDILSGHMEGDWLLENGFQGGATGWGDVAIVLPWIQYLTYGDLDAVRRQIPSMKKWIAYLESYADGCVYVHGPQFGDWLALDAKPGSYHGATSDEFTGGAYFCHVTRLLANMLHYIGEEEESAVYMKKYRALKEDFCRRFLREDGRLTEDTQTAYVLALTFHLTWQRTRPALARRLVELVRESDGHLTTGFLGTPRIARALSDYGYWKEAYDLLLKEDFPSWLYQVKSGATTVWEHWDGMRPDGSLWSADMNSFNHYAYGSIGEWMFRTIAGIEAQEETPGYEHFRIEPRIGGGLKEACGEYESVRGKIRVRWEVLEDGQGPTKCVKIGLEFRIPANTAAEVVLWDADQVLEADGLTFEWREDGLHAEAGSGSYRVVYQM